MLKSDLADYLTQLHHEVLDVGCFAADHPIDYPDVALSLAHQFLSGAYDRGILVCGTGIGMAIAANKVPGIRAACCHDPHSAERARKSNDAQVITLGAQVIGVRLAHIVVDHWLASEFAGGPSLGKLAKIERIERRHFSAPRLTS
jgi:ribose 5-phosphate isomerase B